MAKMLQIFVYSLFIIITSFADSGIKRFNNKNHIIGKYTKYYKYDHIFIEAEKKFGVPFVLLKAIAMGESGLNHKAEHVNSNGTVDYGLMQINTINIKRFNIPIEMVKHPKVNIFLAAAILRELINKYGYSWNTIGKYHSSTEKYKKRWIARIKKMLKKIIYIDKKTGKYNYIFKTASSR